MLLIIMHNRHNYLQSLAQLAHKQGITDTTIIKKKDIGAHLIGTGTNYFFHKGSILSAYDKAFIAVMKNEQAEHLLDLIENDNSLNLHNIEDKGFICSVPFQRIRNLAPEFFYANNDRLLVRIGNFLKESRILLNVRAANKENSIKEVAALLMDAEEIADFSGFLKDVFDRERTATTAIGNEVAIPHARSEFVKDFVMAIGISREGVEFNSLDGKPTKLIFLIGTSKSKGKKLNKYLEKLAHLSKLLYREDFRNSLLKATKPEEIIELFQNVEADLKNTNFFLRSSSH